MGSSGFGDEKWQALPCLTQPSFSALLLSRIGVKTSQATHFHNEETHGDKGMDCWAGVPVVSLSIRESWGVTSHVMALALPPLYTGEYRITVLICRVGIFWVYG